MGWLRGYSPERKCCYTANSWIFLLLWIQLLHKPDPITSSNGVLRGEEGEDGDVFS